ncbi:MAG: EAL domain-containing protein [Fibrobacteraceae bacterium]
MKNFETLGIQYVTSVFQPVISISRGCSVFHEALARGVNDKGAIVAPVNMIEAARTSGTLPALDKKMIETALTSWAKLGNQGVISVNVDTSCVESSTVTLFHNLIQENHLDPQKIIIEICENQIQSTDTLVQFVKQCRAIGFLIAIDDLGKEYSNLDRVITLVPDIIKLDRELVSEIQNNIHKRAIVRSMVIMGEECGSLVVAEGVECWEEIVALMELGIDMFQGYFFARPSGNFVDDADWLKKVLMVQSSFRAVRTSEIRKNQKFREYLTDLCGKAWLNYSKKEQHALDRVLARYAKYVAHLDCLFILDASGIQITKAHFPPEVRNSRSALYYPPGPGGDHSLRVYYLNLIENNSYFSEPYISQATGNLCRTYSCWFKNASKESFILCVDLLEKALQVKIKRCDQD